MATDQGVFIVIEGMDGAGKDIQAELLRDYLVGCGFDVLVTNEPSDGRVGKIIRKILSKELPKPGALEFQRMMVRDRKLHLAQVIKPHFYAGGAVICVRYIYSTIVYGLADGVSLEALWGLNQDFPRPDLAIFLDLDVEASLQRINLRCDVMDDKKELFETKDFLSRVSKYFNDLGLAPKCLPGLFPELMSVDASGEVSDVEAEIQDMVAGMLHIEE